MLLQGVTLVSCLLQRGACGSKGYHSSIKWWRTSPLFAVTIVQTSRPWYNQTLGKNLVASKMHCCIPTAERILPRSLECREHSRHYSQPSFSSCFKSNKSSLKELWNWMLLSTWLGSITHLWRALEISPGNLGAVLHLSCPVHQLACAHTIQGMPCLPYEVWNWAGLLCDIKAHVLLCMHRAVRTVAVILALVLFARAARSVLPKACLLCA